MPTGAIFFPCLSLFLSVLDFIQQQKKISQFLLSQLLWFILQKEDLTSPYPLLLPPLMMKKGTIVYNVRTFLVFKYDGLYDRQPSERWNLSHAVMRTAPSPPSPLSLSLFLCPSLSLSSTFCSSPVCFSISLCPSLLLSPILPPSILPCSPRSSLFVLLPPLLLLCSS